MDDASLILVVALAAGLVARWVRLPPLTGFLVAGFVLHAMGVGAVPALDTVADLGVTLLLFGVGLKLDVRSLGRREVWLTASVHLAVSAALGTALLAAMAVVGVGLVEGEDWRTWLLVGFALSFSSTVFVVRRLEERSAIRSLGGRTAIGILVFQDLAAVVFLAAAAGHPPSPWAALLVLLLPGALLLRRLLDTLGHDELRPLLGLTLALVPGFALFEALGLKGDLGALVVGVLLASHPGSEELAKSLFTLKDLLLVGFFVSIGLGGLPTAEHLLVAAALLLLLPLKALGFTLLLRVGGLRRRTAVLTAARLANFSEFGLIVAVAASDELLGEEWVLVLATAVAASFVLSALPSGRAGERLVGAARRLLPDRPPSRLHPEDRPIEVGHADAVVLGMGRVGRAAHAQLTHEYGLVAVGIESDPDRVHRLRAAGLDVVEGDATDPDFWARLRPGDVRLVLLAMPFHGRNLEALGRLQDGGYSGTVAVVTRYDEDLDQARQHGADTGLQIYDGAGAALADRAAESAGLRPSDELPHDVGPREDPPGD
ncbi:cation:proton antiporter family protein [Nocardioides donggukensis]|uniref:Cation:proton antiporter n=1 Tax=Nocardioides donggukensis TaxID=2774019 RepID=A0A927K8R7_9ACTN|nr:cation:proton antiporter family protein [Nocardioides donggukensis]MBD8871058.1 cation:proton antiporter [Nocardioides donggukensis]